MMSRPTADNTVCLIVDFQERLMPALHDSMACLNSSRIMLQGLSALAVPLLLTEQYPKGLGKTVATIQELLPPDVKTIEKTRFSALIPEVASELEKQRAENIIILGAEAHVCVLQTVLDLQAAGYQTYLPFECTASRAAANKTNALLQMQACGAIVSNVESILFQLLEDAQHPAFKTISKLIQ
jgi:hypothetical protein